MSSAAHYEEDFIFLWQQVKNDYCYLHTTNWQLVREIFLLDARSCTSHSKFLTLLERVLDSLCDFHVQLGENTSRSPYPVPSATDCWAEWCAGQAFLTAVRPDSPSAHAGLRTGQAIIAINDTPIYQAAHAVISPAADANSLAVQQWALLRVVAGYRGTARQFLVSEQSKPPQLIHVPIHREPKVVTALLTWNRRNTSPELGYIRLHNSLGDTDLIDAFDKALAALQTTQGLVLDLRDTPSGGNTTVARAIIGRFIKQEIGYQKHVLPKEEHRTGIQRSWIELASPRSLPTYSAPVVVLVDRWTGSMGEGLAVGLSTLTSQVQIVGTHMAGLRGAVTTYHLPHTQIPFSIPTEQLYTVAGVPRELYQPPILIESCYSEDTILQTGERMLHIAIAHLE